MPKPVKWILIVVAVFALFGACAAVVSGQPTVTPAGNTAEAAVASSQSPSSSKAAKTVKLTENQQQAQRAAEQYQSFMYYSRQGLIDQLVLFDKFKRADATVAVDSLKANWNEMAAKKADQYLSSSGFSREGLTRQLVQFDKYTKDQAKFGVEQAFKNQ